MNNPFTEVYTFAARPAAMDLNFPHKTLEWTAFNKSSAATAQTADHSILLAHAIARQTSSQSARYYVAASQGQSDPLTGYPNSFMDDRMAFFAGRIRSDRKRYRGKTLFETGCFRPDLARKEIPAMHE